MSITQYRTLTLETSNAQSICWNFNAFQDEVPWCWVHTRNLRKPAYDYSSDKAHRGQHKMSITQYRTLTLNTSNTQAICWNFNAFEDETPWCFVASSKHWDNRDNARQKVLGLFSDHTGQDRFHSEEKKIQTDWYRYCLTNVHKKSFNFTITQLKPVAGIDYLHNIDFMAHNQLVLMVWEDKDYLTGKFRPVNPQYAPPDSVSGAYPHTIWKGDTIGLKMTQPHNFQEHYEPQLMYGATLSNVELADMPGVKTFRPGSSNAMWSFNWHRPKKDFQWKESVEWEQGDWLYNVSLPVQTLGNMAKACTLGVDTNDRRGQLMSEAAIYLQQLAKKNTATHYWTWDKGYTANDRQDALAKLKSSEYTKGRATIKQNRDDWPGITTYNTDSAMYPCDGGTRKPVPFMYMALDSFNLEKEYEVTLAWEERIDFTWACQGNRRMLPKKHYQVAMKPTIPYNNFFGTEGPWSAYNKVAYTINKWEDWIQGGNGDTDYEREIEERHKAFATAPRKMSMMRQRIDNKRRAKYYKRL